MGLKKNQNRHDIQEETVNYVSNFLLVCLSSAETCRRIRSPPCRGSSFSTSNSPSCKSPRLVWSLLPPYSHSPSMAFVCVLLRQFIMTPRALSASIQIVSAAFHYNSRLCCTKPLICLSTCKKERTYRQRALALWSGESFVDLINPHKANVMVWEEEEEGALTPFSCLSWIF